jgi:hypothetical protein
MTGSYLKTILFALLIVQTCGCAPGTRPSVKTADTALELVQVPLGDGGGQLPRVRRTTIESGVSLAVEVNADNVIGNRIPVRVELSNQTGHALLLTYSQLARTIRPVVRLNGAGKLPFAAKGEAALGNREETSNRTYEVPPGKTWKAELDLSEFYAFELPRDYTLGVTCEPEWNDLRTGERRSVRFEVGGVLLHVRR